VIIVSQRISTVAEADQVLVVDDGRVVGVGTHEELLADCPTYAEFADSQWVGAR
jgi:ATP-binding cassette subfamily B protein